MRGVAILATVALALGACASSYGLGEGDASYDAIKAATDECRAKGGIIEPKPDGDIRKLADYECKIGGAK
jgi:hypothetical protein